MIISSEKTGKTYNTVEECLEAEKLFDAEQLKKKEEEERKAAEKTARMDEIHAAKEAIRTAKEALRAAEKRYIELVNAYNRDYAVAPRCFVNGDNTKKDCNDKNYHNQQSPKEICLSGDDALKFLNSLLRDIFGL